jgi:antagonist of KipI
MTLHVVEAGLSTWVVDCGRENYRSLGVPVGGAADRAALALGNGLVGNRPDAAALEINLAGPTLRAGCRLACVLHGAPFELFSDRKRLRPGWTFTLELGETVSVRGTSSGLRGYFCVRGGILASPILGSRSSLQPVGAGTDLPCSAGAIHYRSLPPNPLADADPTLLRVLPGPQVDWIVGQGLHDRAFRVKPASNRMGLRLQGEPFALPQKQLVSEPVCPGSVQVTGDGQCIVLGVDGQTIGGYPKIAQVISADLDKLGQLRPGEDIHFAQVTPVEATAAHRRRQALLRLWLLRLNATAPGVGSLVCTTATSTKDRGQRTRDKGPR